MTAAAIEPTTKEKKKRAAQRAFVVSLFDLSWRLLGSMLLPLFIGLYIDSRVSGEDQAFALIGFASGMVAGVFVIKSVIKKISQNGGEL
jgi:F0F1-type ATP synthase assembly protein I